MDKMKILLSVILMGAVVVVVTSIYILTLFSVVVAELYLFGLVFPGIIHSEILTNLLIGTLPKIAYIIYALYKETSNASKESLEELLAPTSIDDNNNSKGKDPKDNPSPLLEIGVLIADINIKIIK